VSDSGTDTMPKLWQGHSRLAKYGQMKQSFQCWISYSYSYSSPTALHSLGALCSSASHVMIADVPHQKTSTPVSAQLHPPQTREVCKNGRPVSHTAGALRLSPSLGLRTVVRVGHPCRDCTNRRLDSQGTRSRAADGMPPADAAVPTRKQRRCRYAVQGCDRHAIITYPART